MYLFVPSTQNKRIKVAKYADLVCFIFQNRCQRVEPPCKYFHPPEHLREQLTAQNRGPRIGGGAMARIGTVGMGGAMGGGGGGGSVSQMMPATMMPFVRSRFIIMSLLYFFFFFSLNLKSFYEPFDSLKTFGCLVGPTVEYSNGKYIFIIFF